MHDAAVLRAGPGGDPDGQTADTLPRPLNAGGSQPMGHESFTIEQGTPLVIQARKNTP